MRREIESTASSPWRGLEPLLCGADLLLGNLEGAVGDERDCAPARDDSPCFEISPGLVPLLARAGFTAMTLEHRRLLATSRSDLDAPDAGERLTRTGMSSLCALPLSVRDRLLGALVLASRRADAYPPEQLEFLGLVADEIASAVERAATSCRSSGGR